jgi:ribosomal protein L37AE/L43A
MKFTPEDFEPWIDSDNGCTDPQLLADAANAKLEAWLKSSSCEVYSHSYEEGGRAWRSEPDPRSKHKAIILDSSVRDYRWECPECGLTIHTEPTAKQLECSKCGEGKASWPWKVLYEVRELLGLKQIGGDKLSSQVRQWLKDAPTVEYMERYDDCVGAWRGFDPDPDKLLYKADIETHKAKLVCIEEIK